MAVPLSYVPDAIMKTLIRKVHVETIQGSMYSLELEI